MVRGNPILDGNYTIVEVPEGNVSQYPDPYANEVSGDVGSSTGGARRPGVNEILLGMGVAAFPLASLFLL
jgi:hypothetical protein